MSPAEFPSLSAAPLFDAAATPPLNSMSTRVEEPEAAAIPASESWLSEVGKLMNYFILFLIVAGVGTWYRVNSKEIHASVARANKFSKNPINFALYMQGSDKTVEEMLEEITLPNEYSNPLVTNFKFDPIQFNPNQYQSALQPQFHHQPAHIPVHGS